MLSFVVRRLAVAIPTLLILVILSFVLMYAAPGGPFNSERPLPPEVLANIEAKYGLDQPFWQQIVNYVWRVVTAFDFGPSFQYKDRSVNDIIAQGFPVTLTYGFWSFAVAVVVGVSLGIAAAVRQNSWLDYLAVGITVGAQVLPNFVMAPILLLLFTLWLGWLPGGGWNGGQWEYLVMPVIALSTSYMASIARITRSSMLEVLNTNFIRTARAKGLPMRRIIWRHAMKPAILPVLSYLGPTFVAMITGSVVIDIFFSTGGIGQFFVNSAFNRDYSVIMGITILVGALTILFNLLVDVLYAWIDPKIRY
ncbi:oligopeptide ABC transporter permease OppB [Yoonia sediminilitoris]|uniref:Oligopeptide transport system permease protein n=1 Tax=Yoonia sediminilitoris TaxID=1286148 RepID=A0A2T6KMG5_9RHOB|nr:oligopeptide ABC transporter permease OppB [Yoonia sediminilitoris]PUB17371.1 oligopeptide transport system permease protein [Yoonia sediminilitoris]RCW97666.1 oligopeptide transport system permease protein [Yoonia sediminilitoris]